MSLKTFPNLYSELNFLENNKDLVIKKWINTPATKKRLEQHGINPNTFANKYANAVYDYFLGVITGKTELGNCPVIMMMLEDFKSHHIPLDDLFIICVTLKNYLILTLEGKDLMNKHLLAELMVIMDANFAGVMNRYIKLNYTNLLEDIEKYGTNAPNLENLNIDEEKV